jgi:hypothetical protein
MRLKQVKLTELFDDTCMTRTSFVFVILFFLYWLSVMVVDSIPTAATIIAKQVAITVIKAPTWEKRLHIKAGSVERLYRVEI